jgi:hypothetical protein
MAIDCSFGLLAVRSRQDRAQATPLPRVKDSDGRLGLVRLPGDANIPGHPHQLPGAGHHRDQGLMVAVVDVGEVGQALLGQVGFAGEEPPVKRGLAELVVRLGKARPSSGAHWPDQHPVPGPKNDPVRDDGSVHGPSIAW